MLNRVLEIIGQDVLFLFAVAFVLFVSGLALVTILLCIGLVCLAIWGLADLWDERIGWKIILLILALIVCPVSFWALIAWKLVVPGVSLVGLAAVWAFVFVVLTKAKERLSKGDNSDEEDDD